MTKLIIWIYLCSGPTCHIADYEEREFSEPADCQRVLDLWRSANKNNRGVCVRPNEQG